MNRRGMALVLAVALVGAILPATLLLSQISRSHLQSALDDYHRLRAAYAARGVAAMAREDLEAGGEGRWQWPDEEPEIKVIVIDSGSKLSVEVQVAIGRAQVVEIMALAEEES